MFCSVPKLVTLLVSAFCVLVSLLQKSKFAIRIWLTLELKSDMRMHSFLVSSAQR